MEIGSILYSDRHGHYIGEVLTKPDVENPPSPDDYGLGRFVKICVEKREIYGVIFNTILHNPLYNFWRSRRIPNQQERNILAPDSADDATTMIEILLIGSAVDNSFSQDISGLAIPQYSKIFKASDEEIKKLHRSENGNLQMRYLDELLFYSDRNFKIVLGEIIRKLKNYCNKEDHKKLDLIFRNFLLQRNFFLSNGNYRR